MPSLLKHGNILNYNTSITKDDFKNTYQLHLSPPDQDTNTQDFLAADQTTKGQKAE